MEFNIAVVDDIPADRLRIAEHIGQFFSARDDIINITEFDSAESFLKVFRKGQFEIVFLDICMDGMNGIELSERLRLADKDMQIIFMSTSREYVFRVFAAEPKGYLCKPYQYEDFAEVMTRAVGHFTYDQHVIDLKLSRSDISLPISEIICILSNNHITEVETVTGQVYKSTMLFKEFEDILADEPAFLNCNRGIFINMDYAVSIKDTWIIMQDGRTFPIRQRDKLSTLSKFTKYAAAKVRRKLNI